MTLMKSVLLSGAAGLAFAGAAQAADLPSRKAAPANYVKICDAYGAGFYTIPGTDTCLRVGGYVRVEWQYTPGNTIVTTNAAGTVINNPAQVAGALDSTGSEVRGRVDMDARTPTALGTVRTLIQLRSANTSGIRNAPAMARPISSWMAKTSVSSRSYVSPQTLTPSSVLMSCTPMRTRLPALRTEPSIRWVAPRAWPMARISLFWPLN